MFKGAVKTDKLKEGETLTRRAEDLQRRLDGVAQSNDALKRFMDRCEYAKSEPNPCILHQIHTCTFGGTKIFSYDSLLRVCVLSDI